MDSTVIEEIAKQLGMAVDDAGVFIQQYLPQYAGLQIVNNIAACIILFIIFAACIFGIVKFKKYIEDSYWYKEYGISVYAIIGVVMLMLLVFLAFIIANVVGWVMFPEAKLIDMVLKRI